MMLRVVSFTGDYTPAAFTAGLSVKKKTQTLSHRSVEVARRDHTCSSYFPALGRPTRLVKYLLICCLKLSIILSCVFTDNFGGVKLSYILCIVYIVETKYSGSLNTKNFCHPHIGGYL